MGVISNIQQKASDLFKKKPEPTDMVDSINDIAGSLRHHFRMRNLFLLSMVAIPTLSFILKPSDLASSTIAVVRIDGNIHSANKTGNGVKITQHLESAINDEKAKAIVIEANSPGGSPVHAEIIYEKMRSLIGSTDKPIYVTITDMCASACYYAIAPAENIYAHKSSMVGSIGVKMSVWSADEAVEKLGLKKHTLHRGDLKNMLDTFSPMTDEQFQLVEENLLNPLYDQFVAAVKEVRGHRLTTEVDLFSGFVWTGEQSVEYGLVDEIKTSHELYSELQEQFPESVIKTYGHEKISFSNLFTAEGQQLLIDQVIDNISYRLSFSTAPQFQ